MICITIIRSNTIRTYITVRRNNTYFLITIAERYSDVFIFFINVLVFSEKNKDFRNDTEQ